MIRETLNIGLRNVFVGFGGQERRHCRTGIRREEAQPNDIES
jgi:hypothetical protein